jgi:hypothetical protein
VLARALAMTTLKSILNNFCNNKLELFDEGADALVSRLSDVCLKSVRANGRITFELPRLVTKMEMRDLISTSSSLYRAMSGIISYNT